MSKTRQEKIDNLIEKIAQLENQRKQEQQKQKTEERNARTKRLCKRHGLLEKYMPDLVVITDEQFETFIKKGINTSYGQKILGEIIAKSQNATTDKPHDNTASTTNINAANQNPAATVRA